ncbi:MAG: outer membrane beta-barrel protein [Planctomycetia bacterium]|nr:outer membrane beta-barrel protein [Planctomycetia bacterium]
MKTYISWKRTLTTGCGILVLFAGNVLGQQPVQGPVQTFPSTAYSPVQTPPSTAYSPSVAYPVAQETPCLCPETVSSSLTPPELAGTEKSLFFKNLNASPAALTGSSFLGQGAFFIDGYIDQGLTFSDIDGDNFSPVGPNDKKGYEMNQLYLALGRNVCQNGGWSVGGRVDFMYGTDYYYTSAIGLETTSANEAKWNGMDDDISYRAGRNQYGFSMPQFYAEIYSPWLRGIDFKVGHFYSIMGFESPMAPMNFYYSRSYASIWGLPQTMTGGLATFRLSDRFSAVFGAVNEWDAFDSVNDHFSFVAGLQVRSLDNRFELKATVMTGDQSAPCFQPQTISEEVANTTLLNVNARFNITQRLTYAIDFTGGWDDRDYLCIDTWNTNHGRNWYGITNYLFYQCCDPLTLGFRFEWFRDCSSTIIDGGYAYSLTGDQADYYAISFGANWQPLSWLTIRPELRWDWSTFDYEGIQTYDDFSKDSQLTFAADMILRF